MYRYDCAHNKYTFMIGTRVVSIVVVPFSIPTVRLFGVWRVNGLDGLLVIVISQIS